MNTFNLNYTKADLEAAFNLHYAKKYPVRSKLLLILGLLLFVGGIALFFVQMPKLVNLKWLFFFMGLFYVGFYFYRKSSLIKLAMKNPTIKDMKKISFSDKSIRFEGDAGFFEQEWDKFIEAYQDENSILLYLNKHNFFIIPKHVMTKEQETSMLKNLPQIA